MVVCDKALPSLGKGFKKKTANYPHFMDKGRGSSNVDKQWGKEGGSSHVDKSSLM